MAQEQIWVPGAPQPSLEDFVTRLREHIERFASEHADGQAAVEVELRDGSLYRLLSLIETRRATASSRSRPFREDGDPEELIVPVAAIAAIRLTRMEEHPPFGFGRR